MTQPQAPHDLIKKARILLPDDKEWHTEAELTNRISLVMKIVPNDLARLRGELSTLVGFGFLEMKDGAPYTGYGASFRKISDTGVGFPTDLDSKRGREQKEAFFDENSQIVDVPMDERPKFLAKRLEKVNEKRKAALLKDIQELFPDGITIPASR